MENTIRRTWWRWPLMPVLAVAAGCIANWLVALVNTLGAYMNYGTADGWLFQIGTPILAAAAFGAAFVWTSWEVSPVGQRYASTVMLTLLGLGSLVAIAFVWSPGFGATTGHAVLSTIQSVVCTAAGIACLASRVEESARRET